MAESAAAEKGAKCDCPVRGLGVSSAVIVRASGPRERGTRTSTGREASRLARHRARLAGPWGDQGGSPMKRRRVRIRRKWLVPLALLLLPPLLWALVVAVTPTEWARSR